MLVVTEDKTVLCGAAVGVEGDLTVLVFQPGLSQAQRRRLAKELLDKDVYDLLPHP